MKTRLLAGVLLLGCIAVLVWRGLVAQGGLGVLVPALWAALPLEPLADVKVAAAYTVADTTPVKFGSCSEPQSSWHPPVVDGCSTGHEHGDAPPSWVTAAGFQVRFAHAANTPRENELKHTSFKGYSVRFKDVDLYVVVHLDTNPSGHSSRFHSYQTWARDPAGNVSHWHGWLDFGTGDDTGPQVRRANCFDDDSVRPIMGVNGQGIGCGPLQFESWYSRAGGSGQWAWDFGFNTKANYFVGGDPTNPQTWTATGELNDVRRIEAAWYADRQHPTGKFWATQWGDLVSGPNDALCGTSRTYGQRSYPVLCLEQHIAPTMVGVTFDGNAVQRTFDTTGVQLPN